MERQTELTNKELFIAKIFFQDNLHYRQDLTRKFLKSISGIYLFQSTKFKQTSFPSVKRLFALQNVPIVLCQDCHK